MPVVETTSGVATSSATPNPSGNGVKPVPSIQFDATNKEPDQLVPALIEHAARLHVSDLFFSVNEDYIEVAARHLGILRSLCKLSSETGRRCVSYVKTLADMNISERRRPQDGRWFYNRSAGGSRLDLRVNTIPTLYGEDLTIRILDQQYRLLSIDQLGFDPTLQNRVNKLLASPNGLILVTGPTETGKSTTLYAFLSSLNTGQRKINTIEDPIEYSLKGIRQSQVNSHIGLSFDELLRSVLRQAPDVIMIGEIRDVETAMTAIQAAASGHLVLSTLHAPVADAAIHTLLRLGVNPHMLSISLIGVISQRLLRTLCPHCKRRFDVPTSYVFQEIQDMLKPGQSDALFASAGCEQCYMTGYQGRTGVFEMLTVTPKLRALIDERASTLALRKQAVADGMVEFRRSALHKVALAETSIEEVVRILPTDNLGI